MSPSGTSLDKAGVLRDAIARIESDGQGVAASFGGDRKNNRVALGAEKKGADKAPERMALDTILQGGIGRGALHEIVAASHGDAAAASGFALALAARFAAAFGCDQRGPARQKGAPIVWIVEDHAKTETGSPYAPGLAAHGIDPARLILVATANAKDSLWAMEEALKCQAIAVVVTDLWRLAPYDLAASRRLVLAAQKSGTPGLMVPAGAAGHAKTLSSAARTRFEARAMPGRHLPSAGGRTPLPGLAAWEIRVARIRAGPSGGNSALDQDRFWPVLWDHEEAYFRDAFPLPLSPQARDRSHRARA